MAELKEYKVTEKAGRHVAGQRNNGVGSTMLLTEAQAKLAVDTGQLKPMFGKNDPPAKVTGSADELYSNGAETDVDEGDRPSMDWTKDDLVKHAADIGAEHDADAKKADILAAIELHSEQ